MAALGRYLVDRGHEVLSFGVAGPRDAEERVLAPGVFQDVSSQLSLAGRIGTRGARESALARALVAAAAAANCDVTVGVRHLHEVDLYWPHGGGHMETLRAKAAAKADALCKSPASETSVRGRHKMFLRLERELMLGGGARRIACVSELIRRELECAYPEAAGRLALTANGVDLERFLPREWRVGEGTREGVLADLFRGVASPKEPLLIFVAREPQLKGLPALCRALASLQDHPWHLVVAGPARFKSVESGLAQLGKQTTRAASIRQSERWTYLPEADVAALFSVATLAVQPTWRDPCSLATLESLACGRRVLTTLANGAASHVLCGEAAPQRGAVVSTTCGSVITDPSDDVALASALRFEFERGTSNGTRRVREQAALFPAEQTHAQLEALLQELCEARGR